MESPAKEKRKPLTELFTDLDISSPSASTTRDLSPIKRRKMRSSLHDTISGGWPSMSKEQLRMIISADDVYRQYSEHQNPQALFEKASLWISRLQETAVENSDVLDKELHEGMIKAMFGSNLIERAGLNLDITVLLCRKIFAGDDVGEISEREDSHMEKLAEIVTMQPELKGTSAKYILRSRNEVVQHARAFQHVIHAFVVEKRDLSEELIKTHLILTRGVPIIEEGYADVPSEEYGGVYRNVIVGAGSTNFTVPKFIPAKMKEMCDNLASELASAEASGKIDPFSIASKYSMEFVQIHPFRDGNGRVCRMILNAILCRYAGVIIPIGESEEEREEYMGIKRRASKEMEGHGEYATFILRRATTTLQKLKKKVTGKSTKN